MRVDNSVQGVDNFVTLTRTILSPPSFLYKYLRVRNPKGLLRSRHKHDQIQRTAPIAELRRYWAFVEGPEDAPTFGRLGEAAKRAGMTVEARLPSPGRKVSSGSGRTPRDWESG